MHKINLNKTVNSRNTESSFDDFIYCEKCECYVFEYCSIHGPLLVIPDHQVPVTTGFPIPRSTLSLPQTFLHLAPSALPGAGLGVFSSLPLPRGVRFGPYQGVIAKRATSTYCWQIYRESGKRSHVVDASDANASNWMRYVNCARHWREQNMIAYQYQGQIYYRSIKIIPRFTELLVFYGSEAAMALKLDLRRYNTEKIYKDISAIDQFENHQEIPPAQRNEIQDTKRVPDEEKNTKSDCSIEIEVLDNNTTYCDDVIDDEMTSCTESYEEIVETGVIPDQIEMEPDSTVINENYPFITLYSCQICFKSFDKPYGLKRHCLTHKFDYGLALTQMPTSQYICDVCRYPCDSQNNLIRHKQKKHSLIQCQICYEEFFDRIKLTSHVIGHVGLKKYNDNTDGQTYGSRNIRNTLYKCDLCEYKTNRRDSLIRHLRIHYKIKKES